MPLPIAGIGTIMLISQMGAASTAAAASTGFSTAATVGIAGTTGAGCLLIREGIVRLIDRFRVGDEPEAPVNGPESPQNTPESAPQIAGPAVEEEPEINEKVALSSTQGLEETVKQEPEVLEKVAESEVQSLKSGAESETQTLGKTIESEGTQVLKGMDEENNDPVQAIAGVFNKKIGSLNGNLKNTNKKMGSLKSNLKNTNKEIGSLKANLKKAQSENEKEFVKLTNMSVDILVQLAELSRQMDFIQQGSSRGSSRRSSDRSSSSRSHSSNSHRSSRSNNAQVVSPDLNNAPPIGSTISLHNQNFYQMPEPSSCRVSTWANNQQAMEELGQDHYPETVIPEATQNTMEEPEWEFGENYSPERRSGSRIRGHAPFNPNNERGISSSSSQSSYGTMSISQNSIA